MNVLNWSAIENVVLFTSPSYLQNFTSHSSLKFGKNAEKVSKSGGGCLMLVFFIVVFKAFLENWR